MITITAKQILETMQHNDPTRAAIAELAELNFRIESRDGVGWTAEYDNGVLHMRMANSPELAIKGLLEHWLINRPERATNGNPSHD